MKCVDEKIARVEEIIQYSFHDKELILAAITHPSAVDGGAFTHSYERLEFLGDSVMGAIVAYELWNKFPDIDEGKLTRLKVSIVSGKFLSKLADDLGFTPVIIFGMSESGTGSRGMKSALENVFEAVVGALMLDGGIEEASRFIKRTLGPFISLERASKPENPKSLLQELCQKGEGDTPVYELVSVDGPPHSPSFVSRVLCFGKEIGRGEGRSKKESEVSAAYEALNYVEQLKSLRSGARIADFKDRIADAPQLDASEDAAVTQQEASEDAVVMQQDASEDAVIMQQDASEGKKLTHQNVSEGESPCI